MKHDIVQARWIRSRACSSDGCVEVAHLAGGGVAVRDSKDAGKPPHMFDREEWLAFIAGVKNGEFDLPVS
ncbi:MAG TPA: DUF397 domain-containing protein [Streptosporangiaceae bacterium]|jgi:hypothetical protein|nr:DUF397 domain-containing protein [Streptosporangiaceae bacterium]